ncbi:sigma-54 dependent transcriptional regulator [Myxococcota bacterium]|nr:sigma-54 dependent transcriptional regulator [Myxococcota bacterium]
MRPASILVVDDDLSLRQFLEIMLARDGHRVTAAGSGEEALSCLTRDSFDLMITDLNMDGIGGMELLQRTKEHDPAIDVVMITAFATTESAIEAMKRGAFDYVVKPFKIDELRITVDKALARQRTERENILLKRELADRSQFESIIGTSVAMLEVFELIRKVKDTRINVLITGESGTGKELVARAIHFNGQRRDSPFVSINCGAIPEGLMESELFGHRKGAFTGAQNHKDGLFQAADGGTLFLDEIGEMVLPLQVKLLRALQERRIRPVGGLQEVPVDVRIIAASNRELPEEVQAGRFREDLYYRLNVVAIRLPALRERFGDLPLLAEHFVRKYSDEYGRKVRGISADAMAVLERYGFPGNIRELQHVMERSVALGSEPMVTAGDLPAEVVAVSGRVQPAAPQGERPFRVGPQEDLDGGTPAGDPFFLPREGLDLEAAVGELEKSLLLQALERSGGRKKKAAELLRISFRSFRYRLAKYGISEGDSEEDSMDG